MQGYQWYKVKWIKLYLCKQREFEELIGGIGTELEKCLDYYKVFTSSRQLFVWHPVSSFSELRSGLAIGFYLLKNPACA